MNKKTVFASVFLFVLSTSVLAGNAQMNVTITRIINQINAIMPLIDKAKSEQDKNPRIKVHFDSFKGADNKLHPGLRQDLITIRNSLIGYINKPAIEPKTIKPLANDFIGGSHEF